ncbi:MAG: T9SS type A sorting domain-containing protein, partial [Saprospiraceae bacterium]
AERVSILVTDVVGKVVSSESYEAVKGINTRQMDINALANGIYFLTIDNGVEKVTDRIIKN